MWESRESVGAPRAHGKHSKPHVITTAPTFTDNVGWWHMLLIHIFYSSLRTKWTASSSATRQKGLTNDSKRLKTLCWLQWPALTCGGWKSDCIIHVFPGWSLRFVSGSRDGTARVWRLHHRQQWRCILLNMSDTLPGYVHWSVKEGWPMCPSLSVCFISIMLIYLTQFESDCQS